MNASIEKHKNDFIQDPNRIASLLHVFQGLRGKSVDNLVFELLDIASRALNPNTYISMYLILCYLQDMFGVDVRSVAKENRGKIQGLVSKFRNHMSFCEQSRSKLLAFIPTQETESILAGSVEFIFPRKRTDQYPYALAASVLVGVSLFTHRRLDSDYVYSFLYPLEATLFPDIVTDIDVVLEPAF